MLTDHQRQTLLHLLFRCRERFIRHAGTEKRGRQYVRCVICTNTWPADSKLNYHNTNCPVPATEAMMLESGVPTDEVYYGLDCAPAATLEEGRVVPQNANTSLDKTFTKE